jgi:3-oxoacyl-[acyl-carrier protein] reductase
VVTGGSGALGAAVTRRLQASGFAVAIHYCSDRGAAEALVDGVEGSFAVQADLSDWDAVQAMSDRVHQRFGSSVGVLVNCAAIRGDAPMAGQSPAEWRRIIDVNLLGTFHTCRALSPRMLQHRYGRIVNVVSPAGQVASPGQTAYSASKAGVIGMTRSLAHECGRRGVTVNCLSPGLMATSMTSGLPPEVVGAIVDRMAVAEMVPLDEVAAAVDLLIASPHLTGQVLAIDGGITP